MGNAGGNSANIIPVGYAGGTPIFINLPPQPHQEGKDHSKLLKQYRCAFSGEHSGVALDFIANIERFRDSEPISDAQLFRILLAVLKGRAASWFNQWKREWQTWDYLKEAIKSTYLSTALRKSLLEQAQGRMQDNGKPFSDFVASLRTIFDHMYPPLLLHDQIEIVIENMLPALLQRFDGETFNSYEELIYRVTNYQGCWERATRTRGEVPKVCNDGRQVQDKNTAKKHGKPEPHINALQAPPEKKPDSPSTKGIQGVPATSGTSSQEGRQHQR